MTSPIEFYVQKAAELSIPLSNLCDRAAAGSYHESGIQFYQHSKQNPNGLTLLARVSVQPDFEATNQGADNIQDINTVLYRDYWFAIHDWNLEPARNNFLAFTVRGQSIIESCIDETQINDSSKIQVPRELFEEGRDYRDGLTWMLQQYVGA